MSEATRPSGRFRAVTASDADDIPAMTDGATTRALYVGSAGNLAVVDSLDAVVTFANVPAGTLLPVKAKRVRATGTTAADIVALY